MSGSSLLIESIDSMIPKAKLISTDYHNIYKVIRATIFPIEISMQRDFISRPCLILEGMWISLKGVDLQRSACKLCTAAKPITCFVLAQNMRVHIIFITVSLQPLTLYHVARFQERQGFEVRQHSE